MIRRLTWAALAAALLAATACAEDADLATAFGEPISHVALPPCHSDPTEVIDPLERRGDPWNRMSAYQYTYQRGSHLYLTDLGADADADIFAASGDNWRWACQITPDAPEGLVPPISSHAAWGPDGEELAYLVTPPGDRDGAFSQFVLLSTDITDASYAAPRPVECAFAQTNRGDGRERMNAPVTPLFSRDGKRLLTVKRAVAIDGSPDLYEVWSHNIDFDAPDCSSEFLLALDGEAISGLAWEPGDGDKLAIVAESSGVHLYGQMSPETGRRVASAPTRVATLPAAEGLEVDSYVGDIAWLGNWILYAVDRAGDVDRNGADDRNAYLQIFGDGKSIDTGVIGKDPAFHPTFHGFALFTTIDDTSSERVALINPRVNVDRDDTEATIGEQLGARLIAALPQTETLYAGSAFRPRAEKEQPEDIGGQPQSNPSGWACTIEGKCELNGQNVVFNRSGGLDEGRGVCRPDDSTVLSCARLGL